MEDDGVGDAPEELVSEDVAVVRCLGSVLIVAPSAAASAASRPPPCRASGSTSKAELVPCSLVAMCVSMMSILFFTGSEMVVATSEDVFLFWASRGAHGVLATPQTGYRRVGNVV